MGDDEIEGSPVRFELHQIRREKTDVSDPGRGRSLAGFQDRHFLAQPQTAPIAFEIGLQPQVDVAQMGHVGERIIKLLLRQRTAAPVGLLGSFAELDFEVVLHQGGKTKLASAEKAGCGSMWL